MYNPSNITACVPLSSSCVRSVKLFGSTTEAAQQVLLYHPHKMVKTRIEKHTVPTRYEIFLEPDLEKCTFNGRCVVDVTFKENTSIIEFHSCELTLSNVVLNVNGSEHTPSSIENEGTIVALKFSSQFHANTHAKLHVDFTGVLGDKLVGFYRSKYRVSTGEDKNQTETRYMATTQFEPVDARRAFPCWDDPSYKAVFSISVASPHDRVAISNMPVKSTEQKGDKTIYHFEDTPKMSTYLVCVCVGEFEYLEGKSNDNIDVRIYTVPGKKEQGKIALGAAIKSLEMFTEWFGIKYPLPKLDLLAIPDFSAGAMENWGAITYRETALLALKGQSSFSVIQNACRTIAHEIAHQWFGNLVTMEWWTHLWLNEGFARWAETLCLDALHPTWTYWQYFVANPYVAALNLDSLKSSHPIEVEVKSEQQINEIFDAISYAKGASVIRMLAAYVDIDVFRKGLTHYLKRHQYENTVTEDLWKALTEVSGKPVAEIMGSWTQQTGYPSITVEEVGTNNDSKTKTFKLSQLRYLRSGVDATDTSVWQVPLRIKVQQHGKPDSAKLHTVLMKEKETTVDLQIDAADSWVTFNDNQTGLYRVWYPEAWLHRISKAVETLDASPAVRHGLQDDIFAFVRAGTLPSPSYLALVQHYVNERDYYVWSSIVSNLGILLSLYVQQPFYGLLKSYVAKLLGPIAEDLGWDARPTDAPNHGSFRSSIISLLGHCDHKETIQTAKKRFSDFIGNNNSAAVPPDLRAVVYRIASEAGSNAEYERLLNIYFTSPLAEEQRRCLNAIGHSKSPELSIRTLTMVLDGRIKAQDIATAASAVVSATPASKTLAWNWVKDHWLEINKNFGDSLFVFSGFVGSVTGSFTTHSQADEVEEFFKVHPVPQAERTIRQSVEKIRSAASWIARDNVAVADWLQKTTA